MRSRWSYEVANVWGIPIRAHVTLLLVLPLLLGQGLGWICTILLGLGIFTTIALHELGHSLVAIRKGCRVREILLLPIGGVAQMEHIPVRPRDEIMMAVSGPAVSLVLFGVLTVLGKLLPLRPAPGCTWNCVELLGAVNLGFVLFNLIPAFPMDGGRILRAWLTLQLGRLRATFVAATIGKAFAVVMGLYGLFQGPFTLLLIAILIYYAAGTEFRAVTMQERANLFTSFFGPVHDGTEDDHDDVIISPPPYEKGRGARARLRTVNNHKQGLFRDLFGG